ncbi:MAG: hypothetical protein ACTTKL_11675 [Treponema sp.]
MRQANLGKSKLCYLYGLGFTLLIVLVCATALFLGMDDWKGGAGNALCGKLDVN